MAALADMIDGLVQCQEHSARPFDADGRIRVYSLAGSFAFAADTPAGRVV